MHAIAAAQSGGTAGTVILGFAIILASIGAYIAPMITAIIRRVPNTGSVIVINLLLGWTVIGWIAALAMACRSQRPQQIAVVPYAPVQPPPGGGNGF